MLNIGIKYCLNQRKSDNVTTSHHKREPRGHPQHSTTRHQQTDAHESTTKQDRNNTNDSHKKHRPGTASKNIPLEGPNGPNGAPTPPPA